MRIFDKFRNKKEPEKRFPPVPDWKPDFAPMLDQVIDRMQYYTNGKCDIAAFLNGTCVVLEDGLLDSDAKKYALQVLHQIYHYHPDMNPMNMDDGNILVQYNQPAANVVIESHVTKHWEAIDKNHQRALATDEVLITPLGPNVFDDFGKKALYGRCFMFMDAQNPKIVKIVRKNF